MRRRLNEKDRFIEQKQQEIKRLQRKLIPVNLLVCLLCIVAVISLLCTPFFSIDLGKITSDEGVNNYIRQLVQEQVGNISGGDGAQAQSDSANSYLSDEAMAVIVNAIVEPVFGSVEASVSLTPMSIRDIAYAEHPGSATTDLLIIGENGLVVQVAESLANSVRNLGGNRDVIAVLQEAVVDLVADELVNRLPEEYGSIVAENKEHLKDAINALDEVTTEDEAVETIMDFLESLDVTSESGGTVSDLSDDERAQIENSVRDFYQATVSETADENGDNFSVEGLICVMASDTINKVTDGAGFADFLKQMLLEGGNSSTEGDADAAKAALAEGEVTDTETEGGETAESGGVIYTTYQELFASLITEDDAQEISDMLVEMVREYLTGTEETIDGMAPVIMAVFWSFVGFAALWGVLFLFSLIHMFAGNKRFTMWYVKLFAPYPAIIFWLAPLIAPFILPHFISGDILMLANVVLASVSSMMWISGLCYLLLWAISILWAFPIKRKIRTANKELKYGC